MKHFILSSTEHENEVGLHTIIRHRQDQLRTIDLDKDRDRGTYRLIDTQGREWFGSDLMVLEPSLDDIEEMNIDQFIDSDKMDLTFLLS